MSTKQTEALKLALESMSWTDEWRPEGLKEQAITAIREALADSALDRMAENARELGLDYEPPCKTGSQCASKCPQCEQPAQQQEQKLEFVSPGGGYVPAIPKPIPLDWKLVPRKATPEMLKAMDECAQEGYDERLYAGMASSVYMAAWDASPVMGTLPEQPAQDNTYNYVKSLAESIFKQHFASDEHYASGRIVWGVNDTVIGVLTQIDNMVADMVRRPAQQPEYKHCDDGKVILKNPEVLSQLLREQQQEEPKRWAVFCSQCRKEWSVSYPHPGKSICAECDAKVGAQQQEPDK